MKDALGVLKAPWSPAQRLQKRGSMSICSGHCSFTSVAFHSMLQVVDSLRLQLKPLVNMVQVTSLLVHMS